MKAYYNDIETYCCDWLSNLMDAGLITPGKIDNRSIQDLGPDDVRGYDRVHFFAGISGWEVTLNLAGWGDRPVWTGSCPCTPFSNAGKRKGVKDERHLWPDFYRLIKECRPPVIFGEQVASSDGRYWLGGYAGLQELHDRETIIEVLQELKGELSSEVYSLFMRGRATTKGEEAKTATVSGIQELPTATACSSSRQCSKESRKNEEPRFRFGFGGCEPSTDGDRCRILRSDGDSVYSNPEQSLEHALDRPNRQFQRVCEGQREDGSLLSECHGKHLGRGQDYRNCRGNKGETSEGTDDTSVTSGKPSKTETLKISLSGVRFDLEALGYGVGAADLCAAGIGSPHVRQRIYWLAHTGSQRRQQIARGASSNETEDGRARWNGCQQDSNHIATGDGTNGFWSDFNLVYCADGKARRIPAQPALFPLASKHPRRVARLRAVGNAIVPVLAAEFVMAFMDVCNER